MVRRILISIPLVFLISVLTYILTALIPGNPAITILGARATRQQYAQLSKTLGLDQPLWSQYWHWLSGALRGNLGTSIYSGQSVTQALNERLPVTLSLVVGGVLITAVIGIGLGVISAVRGPRLGAAVDATSLVFWAIPNFWLGVLLVAAFAVAWRALPATGYVPFSSSPVYWLQSLILPVVTIAAGGIAAVAKQTRDSMLDVLARPFIRNLRANGTPERSIIFKHALRNAAIPVITVLGVQFVTLLSGTVLVETIFALPGLGSAAVLATTQHDLPTIQGIALYFTIMVICVNLVLDMAYGWLNPKARVQ